MYQILMYISSEVYSCTSLKLPSTESYTEHSVRDVLDMSKENSEYKGSHLLLVGIIKNIMEHD
jgi:hypothetical protein